MNKQDLTDIYGSNVDNYSIDEKRYRKQSILNSYLRLSVFFVFILSIYLSWNLKYIPLILFVVFIATFLYLVKRHLNIKYKRSFTKKLILINQNELKYQKKEFSQFYDGKEYFNSNHPFSQDIDLFGIGSFFQYINRTKIKEGTDSLSELLLSNNTLNIVDRQNLIREISDKLDWRQEFIAEASLINSEIENYKILSWIHSYERIVPKWIKYSAYIFGTISISLIILFILGVIPEGVILLWLFVGLGINGIFLKKINALQSDASKALSTFQQYSKLLLRIENEKWTNEMYNQKINDSNTQAKKASESIFAFSKLLNSLDQRTNFLISIFTNGFFLYDLLITHKIDNWVELNKNKVTKWFDLVAFFDMQCSLGNFAYNHPHYEYPIITNTKECLKVNDLGHPLLKDSKVIKNNFTIKNENFFIITGANMAGKSTFLRTVSLAIVMANSGLPIFGRKPYYNPIKLITSMRTSDSLSNDESYFFSELKRLRFIIDTISSDKYFIILDEILKGTNSIDKARGSAKFVDKLVKSLSTGIIATHDLSLCDAAQKHEAVQNYYFDAEIINDELNFDYTLKEGICKNMNASFLLRKMEIIDE